MKVQSSEKLPGYLLPKYSSTSLLVMLLIGVFLMPHKTQWSDLSVKWLHQILWKLVELQLQWLIPWLFFLVFNLNSLVCKVCFREIVQNNSHNKFCECKETSLNSQNSHKNKDIQCTVMLNAHRIHQSFINSFSITKGSEEKSRESQDD